MKVIIAGSRTIKDYNFLLNAVKESSFIITEVVCGMAEGVDKLGLKWGYENKIPVMKFPADWNKYGRSAGIIRNTQMADYADALIALWDGKSKGTLNMINTMRKLNKEVYVFTIKN